jgi:hypothetical protein
MISILCFQNIISSWNAYFKKYFYELEMNWIIILWIEMFNYLLILNKSMKNLRIKNTLIALISKKNKVKLLLSCLVWKFLSDNNHSMKKYFEQNLTSEKYP